MGGSGSGLAPGRTLLIRSIVVIAAVVGSLLPAVAAGASSTSGPCVIPRAPGQHLRGHSRALIRCAAHKWLVPGGAPKAVCVADRESGLNPKAESAHRAYVGLFQHSRRSWPRRFRTYAKPAWHLSPDPLNGRAAAVVTIRMVQDVGWGAWSGVGC